MFLLVCPAMSSETPTAARRSTIWIGRVLSAIPVVAMLLSACIKLVRQPQAVEFFVGKFGYPDNSLVPIGVVELACAVIYLIPSTAVLGALLVTTYLGGAVATHVRVADPFFGPIVLGILAWVGLYLREPRLRELLPLRTPASSTSEPPRPGTTA